MSEEAGPTSPLEAMAVDSKEPFRLLFADTFTPTPDDRVDEIMFTATVIVKEIRVIRNRETPHSKLGFVGGTKPSNFTFQVFGLDALDRFTSRFEPLTPKVRFTEQSSGSMPCLKELVTDHLVVHGDYETLSLCIYGCFETDIYPQEPPPKKKETKKEASTKVTKPSIPLKPFDLFAVREFEKVMFEPWKDKSYHILSFVNPGFQETGDDLIFCDLVSDAINLPEEGWKDMLPLLERVDSLLNEAPKEWLECIGHTKDNESANKEALHQLVELLARVLTRRPNVLLLKLTFSLLSRLFCSEIAAVTFVDLEGLEFCYSFLHDDLTCSSLKEACLYCLSYCLCHSYALQRFLHPSDSGETGYQLILSLLTESPPPPGRIFFAVNQVLARASIYHCVISVQKSASDLLAELAAEESQQSIEQQVATICLDLKRLLQALERECRVVSKQNGGIAGVGPFAILDIHGACKAAVEIERTNLRQIVQEKEQKTQTAFFDSSLLPSVRDLPDFVFSHLKHEKLLSVLISLLTIKGLPETLRVALFSEIRSILLLLIGTFNGMAFFACKPSELKLLLQVLDSRVTEGPPERWGSSLALGALHPFSEPTLLSCQKYPERVSAASLACIIVRQLRALALVNCVISPPDGDSHLAAFHFLHLMTSSPVGAHVVSWALFSLNAFSSQIFLDFFVSPQIESKLDPSKIAVPANSQYAVLLLLTLMQSSYFAYVVPQLSPQLLAYITGLTELKTSKQFKSHITQVISRFEAAVVVKGRGMSGLSHLVDRLCKNKAEEERAFVSLGEDDVKVKEKDPNDPTSGPNDPVYPLEVIAGADSAFKLLTFLAFSPSNDLITGLLKQGWATNHLLVLCNSLFTNKIILRVVTLLHTICDFCSKEARKLKDVAMVEAHLNLLETLCVMLAMLVYKMHEAGVDKARDTRIVKVLLRVHSTMSTEVKLFPRYFTLAPSVPPIGAELPVSPKEPVYCDAMIRIRSAISQTLSLYFTSGWNDVEKEFLDVLFTPKSLLPAVQLGSLVLFGDMLPPLIHEFIQAPVKMSEARLRQYQHSRQQWAVILAPYSVVQSQPSASISTLSLLLDCIKSSCVDIHDALVRVLMHLVELSDDLGVAMLEPLVDRTRAEIIHTSSLRINSNSQEHLTHLYLLRMLQTLARLLQNSCCRWVLNEVSVAVAMRPLLQLRSNEKAILALQLLALEVIRLACDVTYGFRILPTEGNSNVCRQYIVSQSPSSADLQVILPDVLRLLSVSTELAVRRMCSRVLTTLTKTQFGVSVMLALMTPNLVSESPCILKTLQQIETELETAEAVLQDQELELLRLLVQHLSVVAKEGLVQGCIAHVQSFVGWKVPTDPAHPLVKLLDHFQGVELPGTRKYVEILSSLILLLKSPSIETLEPQPMWNSVTALAERYKSLDDMLRTQSTFLSLYFPFARSEDSLLLPLLPSNINSDEAGCFLLPNMFEEAVVPTPQLIQALPQSELTSGTIFAEGTAPGPNSKKKFEGKQGRTYANNSFRNRKIGTGRKPSVHVDDFVKQADEKRPGGQGAGVPHPQGIPIHGQSTLPPPMRNEIRDAGVAGLRPPETSIRGADGNVRGPDSMRGPDGTMRSPDGSMRSLDSMRVADMNMRPDMNSMRIADMNMRPDIMSMNMNMRIPDMNNMRLPVPDVNMRGRDINMRGPGPDMINMRGPGSDMSMRGPDMNNMRGAGPDLNNMRGPPDMSMNMNINIQGPPDINMNIRGPDMSMNMRPDMRISDINGMRGPDMNSMRSEIGLRGDGGSRAEMRTFDNGPIRSAENGARSGGTDNNIRASDLVARNPDSGTRGLDLGIRSLDSGLRTLDSGRAGIEGARISDSAARKPSEMNSRGMPQDFVRPDPRLLNDPQMRDDFRGLPGPTYDQRPIGAPFVDTQTNPRQKRARTSPSGRSLASYSQDMPHLDLQNRRSLEDDKRRRVNNGGAARAVSPLAPGSNPNFNRLPFSRSPTPKINGPIRNLNNFPNNQNRKDRGDFDSGQRLALRPPQTNSQSAHQLPPQVHPPPIQQQPRQPQQQWQRR